MKRAPSLSAAALLLAATASQAQETRTIHRVVTTLDANNRSTTLADSQVPLKVSPSGNAGAVLWMTHSGPADFSFNEDAAKPIGINPPDGGTVIRVVEVPPLKPGEEAKLTPNLMMNAVGDHAPVRGVPVSHPLMHRTRTVDYAIIMSGEIDMMLDDKTVHLKAGDVAIQQATNHAWLNHGTEPCRIIFVLMDSKQP
ncbi:MAG TPA: cupin domain-containing protein [Xanthobacteraceae bacterium]|jgi:mannose-6-phosphate isomerase-like protein (cupin superfamily)|nr:cupin domain-containing protein [Xanthobacteraceae bacterium]